MFVFRFRSFNSNYMIICFSLFYFYISYTWYCFSIRLTIIHIDFQLFQLWPENPTYQVYIPGFQGSTTMLAHPNGAVEMAPHSYINGSTTSINRARSVSWRYHLNILIWSLYWTRKISLWIEFIDSHQIGEPQPKWIWAYDPSRWRSFVFIPTRATWTNKKYLDHV